MKTPKVIFWLKKSKNDEGSALIMVNFSYNGNRLKMSTGLTLKASCWNDEMKLPKVSFADYSHFKGKLYEIEEKILSVYKEFIDKGIIPEPDSIKGHVQDKGSLIHETDIKSIHALFSDFTNEKRLEVKELTVKKYVTLQKVLLKEYEDTYKCSLCFDNMDSLFEKRFKYFLTSVKEQTNNTVSKYMDCLKVFLKWAYKKGLHKNQHFTEFTSKRFKTKVISLTPEEFKKILHLNLADNPKLQRVRDWFCFQCLTGQRFSDIANLKWQNIVTNSEGRPEWHLYQIKGNKPEVVEITLVAPAVNILQKMKTKEKSEHVFPTITNQKFNTYIKDVCKLAGICGFINYVTYSGKKAVDLSGPKYSFISSHTARKTFVTISHIHGNMSKESIRAITGHANDKMLNFYIGEDNKHVAKEMDRVWANV
ncbi:site-specific integrase [Pontibacter sp. KCTC 32443]|uniref:site-specific integrase n=1 Tax=Pontibacter TaxID=323449 RepID=UPI00164D2040|nr:MULTISPECIES: site-specific integrase [Pontibacter]MBC5775738.1 site-specific integrase [Pontibacter sp. KCTC 32443]